MPGDESRNWQADFMQRARLLRRTLRRSIKSIQYGKALNHSPVLFANSFPKSGTHLLTQVLAGYRQIGPAVLSGLPAIVMFRGDTGSQRSTGEIMADLQRLLPGDIAYGHIHAFQEAIDFFTKNGVAGYFILRDPRDVAVSHVHYLTSMAADHIHHRYFSEQLLDFDARLMTSIQGVSAEQLRQAINTEGQNELLPLPDIRSRFAPFLNWLLYPQVLTLRYEDFLSDRMETISRVFDHAIERGFQPKFSKLKSIEILSENIDPSRSPTFRSGKSGSWQAAFTPAHKQAFKQVSGDLLIRLGYEHHDDW